MTKTLTAESQELSIESKIDYARKQRLFALYRSTEEHGEQRYDANGLGFKLDAFGNCCLRDGTVGSFKLRSYLEKGWDVIPFAPFDLIDEYGFNHLSGIFDRLYHYGLLFTDRGMTRLTHVAGWLRGLYDAGKQDEAYQYHDWFLQSLMRLSCQRRSMWWDGDRFEREERFTVLGDDGCNHSFNFAVHIRVDHSRWCEVFNETRKENEGCGVTWSEQERITLTKLNCLTHERLYEAIPYRYAFNGGLIFHGGGQNFTIRLGSDANPWSTHT